MKFYETFDTVYLYLVFILFFKPFKFQYFTSVLAENSLMLNIYPSSLHEAASDDSIEKKSLSTSFVSEKDSSESNTDSAAYNGKYLLYICSTMWHENENEMLQLLKSIMRLDFDQSKKRKTETVNKSNSVNHDIFDYEAHVFFDDAIINLPNGSSEPNSFVQQLINIIKDAVM